MVKAQWKSKSGKHSVILHVWEDGSYSYRGNDCGGHLGLISEIEAFIKMEKLIDDGYFQPDANITPMKRVL